MQVALAALLRDVQGIIESLIPEDNEGKDEYEEQVVKPFNALTNLLLAWIDAEPLSLLS